MMAKMKSVWAFGRKPHLARLSPRPDARPPAGRDPHERLVELEAGVEGVLARVEEGEDRLRR
jgi:hypothetical protein